MKIRHSLAALASAALLTGPALAQEKIKVGFMLPYTGTYTALGVAIENGFRLYVDEQGGKLGGREIEQETRGLVVGGLDHHGLLDPRRAGEIDDHARAALHDQTEAERLDQAAPRLPGLGRELERELRHVDHHPVGVGEREGADVDLVAEIDDEAGLAIVAAEAHFARHREVAHPAARRADRAGALGRAGAAEEHPSDEKSQARRADRHGFSSPSEPFYSITGARLTRT